MACFLRFAGRTGCTKSFCEKCRKLLAKHRPARPKVEPKEPKPRICGTSLLDGK